MTTRPTDDQIEAEIGAARQSARENAGTKWRGMTYEQGVEDMGDWVLGDREVPPMEEE